MSRSPDLEGQFEDLLMSHGGPMAIAHVLAEAAGFTYDNGPDEDIPTGHMDEVYALGFVTKGLVALKTDDEGEQGLLKDREGDYLVVTYLTPEAVESLVKDLSERLASLE